jgi:uncharacterized membrane protein
MKLFSFGFCLTLAFLVMLAFTSLHFAYFPVPQAPTPPKYPDSSSLAPSSLQSTDTGNVMYTVPSSNPVKIPLPANIGKTATVTAMPSMNTGIQQTYPSFDDSDYQQKLVQYQKDQAAYKIESEKFMKEKTIPYIKNMIIRSVIALVVLELLAILFVRYISVTVGSAYAIGGFLGAFFGSFSGAFILPFIILASFSSALGGSSSTKDLFDMPSFLMGIGWTALIGVVVLTLVTVLLVDGMLRFNLRSSSPLPPEVR